MVTINLLHVYRGKRVMVNENIMTRPILLLQEKFYPCRKVKIVIIKVKSCGNNFIFYVCL